MLGHIINNDFMSANHDVMKDFSKLIFQQNIYQYHKSNLLKD